MKTKIILEHDSEDQSLHGPKGMVCWYGDLNDPDNIYSNFGVAGEPQVIEKEVEKIVYKDREPEIKPSAFLPVPKERNGVSDLISLKEAGFSVPEILELRAEHLI